jgi:hypothetical protein
MASSERDFIVEKVKELLAASSCCPELKEAAQKYLDAVDTPEEKTAGRFLIAELEEDVQDIDTALEFFNSDEAKELLGEVNAAFVAITAKRVKADGGKTCICPACTAGQAILDKKAVLLGEFL